MIAAIIPIVFISISLGLTILIGIFNLCSQSKEARIGFGFVGMIGAIYWGWPYILHFLTEKVPAGLSWTLNIFWYCLPFAIILISAIAININVDRVRLNPRHKHKTAKQIGELRLISSKPILVIGLCMVWLFVR